MRRISFLLVFLPLMSLSQSSFYIGTGLISSFANTVYDDQKYTSKNMLDFGLYYGNNLIINDFIETVLEVFYLNNRLVLSRDGDKRFELHQNIGFGIKPGVYYKKHSLHINSGMLAVYVFDKDENLGNQLDYFDDSYFYGIDYNYDITQIISCNISFLSTNYESVSHWTDYVLKDFSVLQLTIQYKLY